MKKKNIIIIAAVAVVCIAAYVALAVVPVYPLYEKEAASYAELRAAAEKEGIFAPTKDKIPFTVDKSVYYKDGVALLSPVIGYGVRGTIDYQGTPIACNLSINSYIKRSDLPKEMTWKQYPCVECHRATFEDLRMVTVVFSYGEQNYELYATFAKDTPEAADDHVARMLTRGAALMLMQAGVDSGSYPIPIPSRELTDGWSVEQPNGIGRVTAAAVPHGDTIYYLTESEYQLVCDGVDPYEVLLSRYAWCKEDVPTVSTKPGQETELEDIKLTEAEAATAFSFHIDGQAISLGIRDDDYPWDYEGFPETAEYFATGDHGEKIYSFTHGGVLVSYYTHGEGEEFGSHITSMVTSEPGPATLRGIVVGDTVEWMAEIYPEAVYCPFYEYGSDDTMPYFDSVYIYEPGGHGSCKHIGFFVTDGIVTTIEIVDMIDGRVLD